MNFLMLIAILSGLILACLLVAAFVSYKKSQTKSMPYDKQKELSSHPSSDEEDKTLVKTEVIDIPPNPESIDGFDASYLNTDSYLDEKSKEDKTDKQNVINNPDANAAKEPKEDIVITITPEDIEAHYERKKRDNNNLPPLKSYKDYNEGDSNDIAFYYRGTLFQIENIEKKVIGDSEKEYIQIPLFLVEGNIVEEDTFNQVLQALKNDGDKEHSLLKFMKGEINPFKQKRRTYLTNIEKNKVANELGVKIDFINEITSDHRFFIEVIESTSGNYKVMALPSDNLSNWSLYYSVNNSFVSKETFDNLLKKDKDLLLKKTVITKRYKFNSKEMSDIRASAKDFYRGQVEKGLATKQQANKDFLASLKLIEDMQLDPLFWVVETDALGINLKAVKKRLDPEDETNWGVLYYINNKFVSKERFKDVCIEIFDKVPSEFLEE